jgi:hypothetical protein
VINHYWTVHRHEMMRYCVIFRVETTDHDEDVNYYSYETVDFNVC